MAILRKLPAAVAVAALTVTLVGCGTSQVRDERDEARMERDEAQSALEQTQSDLGQAQSDLEAAQAARDAAQADADAAQADAAAAEQARMEEEQARMEAEQARMDEEAARMAAEQAQADADAARTEAEEAREMAEGERDTLQDAADKADMDAKIAMAKLLLASLGDEDYDDGTFTAPSPADRDDPKPDTFPVFDGTLYTKNSVSDVGVLSTTEGDNMVAPVSASLGGEVEVSVTGYEQTATEPDMIEGFRGAELMKGKNRLWAYTDIANATLATLADLYAYTRAAGGSQVFAILETATGTGDIPWSVAARADSDLTNTETGANDKFTFMGSVRGVAGTFSCTGANLAACTPPTANTASGTLGDTVTTGGTAGVASTGEWTFTPTDPAGTTDTRKGGYLAFGWWMSDRGTDQEAAERFNVDTFAQAYELTERTGTADAQGRGAVLKDTATYSGGAAGKYAMESTIEDSAQGGHFTARATFMANFDADADGNSTDGNQRDGISLTGTIDNFMTGDMERDWEVKLTYDHDTQESAPGMQSPTALGAIMDGTNMKATATWDTGGASDGTGTWTAKYYGPSDAKEADHPTHIVGTFNAAISEDIAHITGAFGATKDMMDDM